MDIKIAYIRALDSVYQELKVEKEKINDGQDSLWTLDALMNVVQPEIKQLLVFAGKGEVYYKYGSNHRKLESAYFLEESPNELSQTDLGRSILELQDIYLSI
ncbi:MAG: hypothetical protein J1F69_04465 [Clostridiales bacterium]|nr:hypothetical protein [Clostridiales bacterium]